YLNGAHYRPRHIHVKVTDPDGIERLTTQLYFEGDPHLSCDAFASTSLVLPFSGSEETEMAAEDVHFVLA
ncbi:MAG: protocatechuate 3,4-dioxygenase beta subunit, partial [Myxococcota bacterium]